MKKFRIAAFLFTLVLILFLLAACGGDDDPTPTAASSETAAEAVEEATEEATAVPPTAEPTAEPTEEPAAEPAEEPAVEESTEEPAASESGLPPAEIMNDEGGPVRLVGISDYTDFTVPLAMQDPSPALLDMVHIVQGDPTQFAPVESQILGRMTSAIFPPPLSYAFDLLQAPQGTYLDVDNDGEADQGVQIFWLVLGANINGGSYLEQLDQRADLQSYLSDPITGNIEEGSLLIYAPDDQQGFPGGFGDDGILFTEDDPAVGLPQGYTVVHFGPDGFTFDRSAEAEFNALEEPAGASSDFSDQGILESFNNLIDELAVRYSFTDFRNLDWEATRAEYLTQVEELDQLAASDPATAIGVYMGLLSQIAQSVRDAHVAAVISDPASPSIPAYSAVVLGPVATNLGVNTTELDDGRIIVTDVLPGSPAEAAGWTFGTEIVSIDGTPVEERIPQAYYNETVGTDEAQRLQQVASLLKFPADVQEVTVEAILPGSTAAESFTMTPGQFFPPDRLATINQRGDMPIEYNIGPNYGYINWDGFEAPEIRVAVWEDFLEHVNMNPDISGVILDMRGNGGGWDSLYFTMASYFFNEENPVSMHWIDQDVYDPEAGGLVREVPEEYLLSAPDPALYYDGPVILLVDNKCASSCEFFSQFLQTNGRATVVGQYASNGAGAPINRVNMPGGGIFQYTKGRAYFAGTDEFNLEAKGVTPDVRVPTTEESELAKLQGEDPVLQTAVEMINDIAAQAYADSIVMVAVPDDQIDGYSAVAPEGWEGSPTSTGVNFTQPGTSQPILGYSTRDETGFSGLITSIGISDLEGAVIDSRQANGLEWTVYGAVAGGTAYQIAAAQEDGTYHLILAASAPTMADAVSLGLLNPAIDAFMLN
ncbi:MAG: S41 family peptidase [Candidatus Promineifilaceae bacterium]|nr:S41 family peptidase [Candidatus Promineifilaceae bacterium]